MNVRNSTRPFLDQIPKRDRKTLLYLKSIYDITFTIRWTDQGWRYDLE